MTSLSQAVHPTSSRLLCSEAAGATPAAAPPRSAAPPAPWAPAAGHRCRLGVPEAACRGGSGSGFSGLSAFHVPNLPSGKLT